MTINASKKHLRIALQFAILALCVFAVWWTVKRMGIASVMDAAIHADPFWLTLSFLPILARFLVWCVKWRRMIRREVAVGFKDVLTALLSGAFVNLTTPTAKLGGGVVRAMLIHRKTKLRRSVAYGWSLADQITNSLGNAGLYGILALSAAWLIPEDRFRSALLMSGGIAIAVLAVFVWIRPYLWRQIHSKRIANRVRHWIPERFRKAPSKGDEEGVVIRTMRPLLGIGSRTKATLPDLGIAALSFASLCVANAMVFKALGSDAPLLVVATLVVIGYFAGTAVGTMGGIGATEFFLIQLYTYVGIDAPLATAATLLHRASYYACTLLFGGVAIVYESRSKAKLSDQPTPKAEDGTGR